MNLRDYQLPAVEFLTARQRALVQAPAGSGKTIIGAAAVDRFGLRDGIIWIANTVEQVAQAKSALGLFLGEECARRVNVCCAASEPDTSRASLVVVDECHHVPAATWKKLVADVPAGCRVWGLSATPFCGDAERDDAILATFKEVFTVQRDLLVERGQLAKARVMMLTVNSPGEFVDQIENVAAPEIARRLARYRFVDPTVQRNRVLWQVCREIGIVGNRMRNRRSIEVATYHVLSGNCVLVLVGEVEHAKVLASQIPGASAVFAAMGRKARKLALDGFSQGRIPCIVATSLADEGMDVPRANVLVLVSAGRSSNKLEQRTGRVLRAFKGKTHGLIYDFTDVGHHFLKAQAAARIRTYKRLGYEVVI